MVELHEGSLSIELKVIEIEEAIEHIKVLQQQGITDGLMAELEKVEEKVRDTRVLMDKLKNREVN